MLDWALGLAASFKTMVSMSGTLVVNLDRTPETREGYVQSERK